MLPSLVEYHSNVHATTSCLNRWYAAKIATQQQVALAGEERTQKKLKQVKKKKKQNNPSDN